MKTIKSYFVLFSTLCIAQPALAQNLDSIPQSGGSVELIGGYAGNKQAPFWMRSNQFGSVPLEGASGSVIGRIYRNYNQTGEWKGKTNNNDSLWDWGYGLEGRFNAGNRFEGQLIDAHIKIKFAMFEARVGRSRDVMGLNGDSLLTSGNFAVSGNALGVPKLEISIPEYYRIPWFDGLFSFKGNFANGYMGNYTVKPEERHPDILRRQFDTFLHQKSLYGRIAKERWKLQFYSGFNHQVQWSDGKSIYSSYYDLNQIQTLWYVLSGKAYGNRNIPTSKIGNHQGSIDIGVNYNLGAASIMIYRQNFYDIGALSKLANIKDGLNGITFTNNQYKKIEKNWDWHKILFEFFYSKDQAGYPWSKPTQSGNEDYYNNYFYYEGWSYKNLGVGSPLIVASNTVKDGQANDDKNYFINNRVVALQLGASGSIRSWNVLTKINYSKNYGTFATSEYGNSLGQTFFPPQGDIFKTVSQISGFLKVDRTLKNKKTLVGTTLAIDYGDLLYKETGLLFYIKRYF